MKKNYISLLLMLLMVITGCTPGNGSDPIPPAASSEKAITSFSLSEVVGTINETEKTIAVAMPFGTDVTAMVATFTTNGASVKVGETVQVSGTTVNNFTNQVTYTVTATDATTQDYTVVVTVAKASAKAITTFSLNGFVGAINEAEKTIAVTLPFGSPMTNRIAKFTTTGDSVKVGSTIQVSGTTLNNFTNPVVYTVTAADSSTQDYTVTVTVAKSSAKAITAFSLNGSVGTINETAKTIAVTMPYGTYVKNLVATFTKTGVSVKVGSTVQVSGTTAHDFTSSVTYTVVAADSSTQDYIVTVIVSPSPAKAITAFSLAGVTGTINETGKTIAVTMPFGTDFTALVATFTTTGSIVKVGSTLQISGTTANNFTSSVVYTVTAADATTQDYIVTVTVTGLVLYYVPGSTSDPSICTGSGTITDPYVGFCIPSAWVSRTAAAYLAPGTYIFGGVNLPNNWNLYGRTADYSASASLANRPEFSGIVNVNGGTSTLNSIAMTGSNPGNAILNISNTNAILQNVNIANTAPGGEGIYVSGSVLNLSGTNNIVGSGNGTNGGASQGIYAESSSTINFVSGTTNITGQTDSIFNEGIYLDSSTINFNGGAVSITGTGAGATNYGISMRTYVNSSYVNYSGGSVNISGIQGANGYGIHAVSSAGYYCFINYANPLASNGITISTNATGAVNYGIFSSDGVSQLQIAGVDVPSGTSLDNFINFISSTSSSGKAVSWNGSSTIMLSW
jgi:glycopeptide antibiotics resistance protein